YLDPFPVHDQMSLEHRMVFQQSPIGTFDFAPIPVGMGSSKAFDRHVPILRDFLQEGFLYLVLHLTQNFLKVRGIILLTNRNGMEPGAYHGLKRFDHLALSNRQHLNGFTLMLTDPGAIDFLYPMGDRILVGGIGCPE